MSTTHTVQQGEHLVGIVAHSGLGDWKKVWEAPENRAVREQRKNPNVLFPGDVVTLRERTEKSVEGATETRHRFLCHGAQLRLRIVLRGSDGRPLAGAQCELHLGALPAIPLESRPDGLIEHPVPSDVQRGLLIVKAGGTWPRAEIPIFIGYLDPIDTETGQHARLNNLGYFAGDLPVERNGDATDIASRAALLRSAIEEFQCDERLAVDGKCGPKTQAKLLERHGC